MAITEDKLIHFQVDFDIMPGGTQADTDRIIEAYKEFVSKNFAPYYNFEVKVFKPDPIPTKCNRCGLEKPSVAVSYECKICGAIPLCSGCLIAHHEDANKI